LGESLKALLSFNGNGKSGESPYPAGKAGKHFRGGISPANGNKPPGFKPENEQRKNKGKFTSADMENIADILNCPWNLKAGGGSR
jgi:hypothetical protein